MNPTTDPFSWLTRAHGHQAWLLVYALVAIPLLVGLIRGRAPGAKIAFFPVLALPVIAFAVIFVSMLRSSLVSWAPTLLTARGFERGARIEDGTRLQRRRRRRRRSDLPDELARSRSRIGASQRRADRHTVVARAINQQTSQMDHLSPGRSRASFEATEALAGIMCVLALYLVT